MHEKQNQQVAALLRSSLSWAASPASRAARAAIAAVLQQSSAWVLVYCFTAEKWATLIWQ
jgi:hypothetical protein